MKKLLIFDFDGTIADTLDVVYHIYLKLTNLHHIKVISKNEFLDYRALPLKERLKKQGISLYKIPKIMKSSQHLQHDYMDLAKPFDGIKEVLEHLSKSYKMVIISSNTKSFIIPFLNQYELNYFDHVYGNAKLFGKAKMIKKVVKHLGLDMNECLYIGDEVRDIKACQKLNLDILSVSYGYDDYQLLEKEGAKHLVHSTYDIEKSIQEIK